VNTNSEDNLSKFLKQIAWFEIQKLSAEHDLTSFCCGNSKDDNDLNAFLKEDALTQQEQKINVTHVAVLTGTKRVIGFVTTMNDKLRVNNKEKGDMHITAGYSDFPSVKIGRLAVDMNHEKRHVGTTMLQFIIGLVLENAETIGCRFLIVDSYPKSVEFYLRKGFVLNLVQDQTRIKVLKEKPDGKKEILDKTQRETISLRYDLLNPKE
jgi:hypothetical protein